MDQPPYHDVPRNDLILRDRLAADRNLMAAERTFLAYVRTALAFLITGGGLIKFVTERFYQNLGWFFCACGILTLIMGAIRLAVLVRRYRPITTSMPGGRTPNAAGVLTLVTGIAAGLHAGMAQAADLAPPPQGGEIRMSCGGPGELSLQVEETGREKNLFSTNSVFFVRPGSYRLWFYRTLRTDADGREWSVFSNRPHREDDVIRLAAGSVTNIEAGPPLTAGLRVTTGTNNAVSLDFVLTDAAGDSCRVQCNDRTVNPRFVVTDAKGEKVLTGTFQYG